MALDTYFQNDKRFVHGANRASGLTLDEQAQQQGYRDFADLQEQNPVVANQMQGAYGSDNADVQVAKSDELNPFIDALRWLPLILGGGMGAAALLGGAGAGAGGTAAAGAGGDAAAPSLASLVTPFSASSLPASTAASLGTVPAAVGVSAGAAAPLSENAGGQFLHSGMFPASGDISEAAGPAMEGEIDSAAEAAGGVGLPGDPTMAAGATPGTITSTGDTVLDAGDSFGSKIPGITKAVGAGLSAAAGARATGRAQQEQANQISDREDTARAIGSANQGNTAATIDQNQRQFKSNQAQLALKNALLGGLLQGTKDISFTGLPSRITDHMPTVTGGLRPSALTGATGIGSDLQKQALLDLMDPENASGPYKAMAQSGKMPSVPSTIQFPPLRTAPQAGALDTFLQFLGPLATVGGSFF